MYKLLLATNSPEIASAFQGVRSWETRGFKTPRVVGSTEEAIASLAKHHADGIAIGLPTKDAVELVAHLMERFPLMPVMRAAEDTDTVLADVNELGTLLNQLHADYSNDSPSEAEMMQLLRHDYFRKVIGGQIHDPDAMIRHLRLLRSRMDTDRACVLIQLGLPDADGYLTDHWHYGPDRLEVAMRNIFGAELEGMRILVSVLPDGRLFLLACPMFGEEAPALERLTDVVLAQTHSSIQHVRDYLGIDLKVASVRVLRGLTELAV